MSDEDRYRYEVERALAEIELENRIEMEHAKELLKQDEAWEEYLDSRMKENLDYQMVDENEHI